MRVYHEGYNMAGSEQRVSVLMRNNPKLLLIDTRLSPRSMRPGWNGDELAIQYGKRYRQAGKLLGNRNYAQAKHGAPIDIVDIDAGVAVLIDFLQRGYDLLLICQCVHAGCHRYVILNALKAQLPAVEILRADESVEQIDVQPSYKCLSIRPPYGEWIAMHSQFVAAGLPPKTIENREWPTKYRGPVLIHSSKKFEEDAAWHWSRRIPGLDTIVPATREGYTTSGKIIALADLVDVVEDSNDPWFVGSYGWVFANIRPLLYPVPYRGALKLFDVPGGVIEKALPQGRKAS